MDDMEVQLGLTRVRSGEDVLSVWHRAGDSSARLATVDGIAFDDLPALLEAADGRAENIAVSDEIAVRAGDILTPVGAPRKILCIGQNYLDHVHEGGREAGPAYPDVFAKWATALSDPYADIVLPHESEQIDYEAELTVVIGRRCRRVPVDQVADVVFGFTAADDGSVRDYQFHTKQRTSGKAWDALTPVGPVVVPIDRLGGIRPDLRIRGLLNGEVMQDDKTSSLMFGVPELVSYISTFMTLEPGDLILTGTPAGVGLVRQPPVFLTSGDIFEVQIEGIGRLRNRYVAGVAHSN